MTWADRLAFFTPLDAAALGAAMAAWLCLSLLIENPPKGRPSTSWLMAAYRRAWMDQMITRQPRIFDAQIIGSLRQSTAFFASTAVLAIGGTLALMGNAEALTNIASDLLLIADPAFVWELKLLLVALFLTNGFLKFVWSNRLFGYASVLMAAVPNDPEDPLVHTRAGQAADINVTAARAFNRGLRSVYFALTAAAWLAGPVPFLAATLFTSIVILRREFASQSRAILLKDRP